MASANFINECKNMAYENRYGRITIGEPAELTGTTVSITDATDKPLNQSKLSKLSTQDTKILPNEYTQVEYIESTGTQYIDTGVKPTSNTKINIDFMWLGSGTSLWLPLYGERDVSVGTSTYFALYIDANNRWMSPNYAGFDPGSGSGVQINKNQKYNIRTDGGSLYLNNELKSGASTTNTLTTSNYSMYLFENNVSNSITSRQPYFRVYRCKFYEGTTLIRDFIPCYRNNDSVVGLYDLVNNTFYSNKGTGNFVKGNNTTIPNPDYPQEVKTVKGYRNLFQPTLTNNGTNINQANCTVELDNDTFKLTATGTDMYFGQVVSSGTAYSDYRGVLIDVSDIDSVSFYLSNSLMAKNFITRYDSTKTSLGYAQINSSTGTYNIPSGVKYISFRFGNGNAVSGTTYETKVMIIAGSKQLPYVPYGTNWVYEKITGKNLFDKDTTNILNAYISTNATISTGSNARTIYISCEPNTTYTVSRIAGQRFSVISTSTLPQANVVGNVQVYNQTASNLTITTGANDIYLAVYYYLSTADTLTEEQIRNSIQIELGNQATTYEAYKENLVLIPLNDNEACGIDTYKDELIVDSTGHCYLNKKIGKVVLNGATSEQWYKYSSASLTNTNLFASNIIDDIGTVGYVEKSNYFVGYSSSLWSVDSQGITVAGTGTQKLRIRINNSIASNTTALETWLNTHNTEVYYVLETPTLIDLDYTVDTTLFEGVNNISNSENADMDIIYLQKYELNQSNKIQEFTIDDGCYVDGNIVGSVYSKSLNTQLIDALDNDIENTECKVEVGITYEDNNNEVTEYINLGKYTVEKPKDEQTENFTSFTAYDLLMQHLEDKYETALDYENDTITLSRVYIELCARLGLIPVTTTFTNSTLTVEGNPFTNGETNRFVLGSIAKVACAFIDIDYDNNKIDLKWLSNSLDYTYQKSDYSTLEGGKVVYGPINSLVIKSSVSDSENVSKSDDQSIIANGEHQLVITEDYFLYDADKRLEVLNNIWDKVNGLTYTECTLTTLLGKPFHKIGDKIRIYTDDNEYIDSYVLQHTFTYDGAFKSVVKCPVLTEQEIKTKQDISLGEKLSRTEINVNKQGKKIEQIVSEVGEDGEVTAASIVTAINNDTSQIALNADKIDLNGAVTANNNFVINTDGSVEMNNGIIELKDNGTSETTPKIKITSRDNVATNEMYSSWIHLQSTYGREVSLDTYQFYIKTTFSGDNSTAQINITASDMTNYYKDANGDYTYWYGLSPGGEHDSSFIMGYQNNRQFEIYNGPNHAFVRLKGAYVAVDNNGNETFSVTGSTGDTTISGKLTASKLYGSTWTPTLSNANVTYTRREGYYRKIGELVFATFRIEGTINSVTNQGYAFISGLPYTAFTQQAGSLFEYGNCFSNNTTPRLLRCVDNTLCIQDGSTGGMNASVWDAGHGTFYLSGTIIYII